MKKVELEQVIAQINEKIGDANTLKQTIDNATATGKQVDELLKFSQSLLLLYEIQ